MALVAEHLGAAPPIGGDDQPVGAYVMVECADHADPTDELTTALSGSPEVLDAAVTTEGPPRDRLVAFRDRIAEAIAARGVPLKLDVAVPVGALGELMADARRSVARHGGHLVPFGHLAEGNVHLNVLDPGDPEAITAEVLTAAAEPRRHDLGRARDRHRQGRLAPPDPLARRAGGRPAGQVGARPNWDPEPRGVGTPLSANCRLESARSGRFQTTERGLQVPKAKPRSGAVSNGW